MAETKIVSKVRKTTILKNRMDEEQRKKNRQIQAQEGLKTFDDLLVEIEECWENSEAIFFQEERLIFYPKLLILMSADEAVKVGLDALRNNISTIMTKKSVANKWDMEMLHESDVRKIFFEYSAESRYYNYNQILCLNDMKNAVGFIVHNSRFVPIKEVSETNKGVSAYGSSFLSVARVTNNVSTLRVPKGYRFDGKKKSKLQIMLEIGGIPKTIKSKGILRNLINLVDKGYLTVINDTIKLTAEGISAIEEGKCNQIGSVKISKDYANDRKDDEITIDVSKMSSEEKATYFSYYADCDNIRANINTYDIAWLEDPNQGHWELWDGNEGEDLISLAPCNKVYARNPKSDIKSDCIVGIDFGTKSTVVVCQNESGMIRPMPIGSGDIRKELLARDFENPTVMQFIDFEAFMLKYCEKAGRPYTRWQDLIVSHAANESMKDTGVRSTEFYSYLYDLKQWAGEGKYRLNLRDKSGKDIHLTAYNELINADEFNVDPIEIYAYYIGLYINNMNNGIYLDYLLSFPVTYEKNIRNAILKSFEKGLKKSLPESIINDSEVMERFNVVAGASEPAAYAICALEEYGFEPLEDEKVFYGIFDFGGGTSDFDFGLWTKSKEEDLFDYCIEHFGTQGDRYLGGENLLQLLAFEVFAQNIQLCRNEKIPFAKPIELINIPTELTGFVNDSQEARMNQKLMTEKLRPFWERSDGTGELLVDINEFSEFQIGLFNVDGSLKSNLAFEVEIEKLNAILQQRIEKGVKQFFEALKDTFSSRHISKTARAERINIFLAGNSSKSAILQEIFKRNIEEWNEGIKSSSRRGEEYGNHFVLFPALGTDEAKKVQSERGLDSSNSLESPTGKTGVAWGLIEGREGGRIEVKEEVSFENEAKFAFYLGIQKGRNFFLKLRRDEEYSKWIKFLLARRKINEILYTSLPEAASGNLLCSETGVLRKRIEIAVVGDDKYIYIRFVSTNCIEYAVGDAEGNIDENTIKSENF